LSLDPIKQVLLLAYAILYNNSQAQEVLEWVVESNELGTCFGFFWIFKKPLTKLIETFCLKP